MTKQALVIIDVQEAMFSYAERMYAEEQVMGNIISLLGKAREAGVQVVYIQHTEDQEYTKGCDTWQICSRITPRPGDLVIEKPTWDAFHRTSLHDELQALGITDLVFAGLQSEFCVDTTVRRSYSLGYNSVLVEDAHSTFGNGRMTAEEIVKHHTALLGGRFAALKKEGEVSFGR